MAIPTLQGGTSVTGLSGPDTSIRSIPTDFERTRSESRITSARGSEEDNPFAHAPLPDGAASAAVIRGVHQPPRSRTGVHQPPFTVDDLIARGTLRRVACRSPE